MLARTDRHRLLGLLLRIRALAYVIAGLPFLVDRQGDHSRTVRPRPGAPGG